MFDYSTLTLGEVAFIEDLSGLSIGSIADEDMPKGKAMAALVTVLKRRTGFPDFKFNDALNVSMAEVNELMGLDESEEEEALSGESPASVKPAQKPKRS